MESDLVLPSSPPHATIEDVPSSPFFEQEYNAMSPKSSSPPPLFSSDDSRESPDLTNYESPRIFKNKRKGAWWDNSESTHNTPIAKKTKMSRNFDSGVYMMSDASSSSDSLLPPHRSPFGLDGACDSHNTNAPVQENSVACMTEPEEEFCRILDVGLEENCQDYSFDGMCLEDNHIRRIGEITSVIRSVPDPGNELPAEGQYRSMLPELYIDFRRNRLVRLTPSLFNLAALTTLVLSDNKIEELPAQIGQLSNLKELHISNNPLRWLPFEFLTCYQSQDGDRSLILGDSGVDWLKPNISQNVIGSYTSNETAIQDEYDNGLQISELSRLYSLLAIAPQREQFVWFMRAKEISHQRNFGAPEDRNDDVAFAHHPTMRFGHDRKRNIPLPQYLARTPVAYFDEFGSLVKGSPLSPCSKLSSYDVITETSRGAHGVPASCFTPPSTGAVSSLATLSLHAALRHKEHDGLTTNDMREYIGKPLPRVAKAIFQQADENAGPGFSEFKKCHMCGKDYIIPRAEWIEWWLVGSTVVNYPFRVQMCSWTCVPDKMKLRPAKELVWDDIQGFRFWWGA